MVGNVFSSVASNYDLMNDVMSAGLHRLWKDRLVSKLNPFPGMRHLDVAGGTGQLCSQYMQHLFVVVRVESLEQGAQELDETVVFNAMEMLLSGSLETINSVDHRALQDVLEDNLHEDTQIYVCDINPNMLNVGKKRAQERGLENHQSLVWVEGDAEALSFEDDSMDGYTIAFGIRNVTHVEKVLAEAHR
ncbi:S-adenosyl-L-methionine-dependent methyltransferases superfamily protein [Actinidia rufa]|uniref:S-adenosyl-L-methionine-dependent methyltransferases superfamily protein n=1 Tax=Actinidia rufa TaxID=165716 RepID=A0A7J0GXU0_9ERIC|nr:S-adenosyl-L-methionine-dependent methyltransferases superfamily protein [Actinidia rufa]